MIVKSVARKGSSNFSRLGRYILRCENGSSSGEEVIWSKISNVSFEDPAIAMKVIEATQQLNTRSTADKTYHLIVSFHVDDKLTEPIIEDIEQRLCQALGYGEHQRLSALHEDTEHTHLHLAINKIHPETLRIHNPFNDYVVLSKAANLLEIRHQLTRVDRSAERERRSESPAAETLAQRIGFESWQSWVDRTLGGRLESMFKSVRSWQDLHVWFARFGVEVALSDKGGIRLGNMVGEGYQKGGRVDKRLTLDALERRLGAYQGNEMRRLRQVVQQAYQPAPANQSLWDIYQGERTRTILARQKLKEEFAARRAEENTLSAAIWNNIESSFLLNKQGKWIARKNEKQRHQRVMNEIKAEHQDRRERIMREQPKLSWTDWLLMESAQGNAQALDTLRKKSRRVYRESGQFIFGQQKKADCPAPDKVSRLGTLLFFPKKKKIRMTSGGIAVQDISDKTKIIQSLELAQKTWQGPLNLTGTEQFCREIAKIAGESDCKVQFNDYKWESVRRTVVGLKRNIESKPPIVKDNDIRAWIEKRNAVWRKDAKDMHQHELAPGTGLITGLYRGQRNIGDKVVVLIEANERVLVQPIRRREVEKYKRYKIGEQIKVNARVERVIRRGVERGIDR